MQVDLSDLIIDSSKKEEKPVIHHHNFNQSVTQYRIDIRGKKPEEADLKF